jgi:hypothetical protein
MHPVPSGTDGLHDLYSIHERIDGWRMLLSGVSTRGVSGDESSVQLAFFMSRARGSRTLLSRRDALMQASLKSEQRLVQGLIADAGSGEHRPHLTFVARRHLACSQTNRPIAQTSSGPTGRTDRCDKSVRPFVASCTAHMTPAAAVKLPRRTSARMLSHDPPPEEGAELRFGT